ncbi:MAG: 3-dehydroquinate synthase [Butyrivibrio sp.]|nr:3-dehydroquinate synthase [Butyrivibrio sp.]
MSELLNVSYNNKPCYNIIFDSSFDNLALNISELGFENRKIAIITDTNVLPLYGEEISKCLSKVTDKVFTYAIPAGEEHKNLSEIEKIYEFLITNHFDRHDMLVALGGGVVGDMTGFTAASYLRGIAFIQIPTTLLAQCDSSIGGKTGVDFNSYKNMVGAFYMPRLVYMNVNVLKTLNGRQFSSGFAEVMKHGLIKDLDFYLWLIDNMVEITDRDTDILIQMIKKSCEIKKAVVEKDPTEKGDRAMLNFGHTIGHAIEKARNFELLHGECVALGCVAAAFISWKKDYISMEDYYEVRDMFVPFGLPISVENIDPEVVIKLMKSDKKADSDKIRFILLKKIGKAFITTEVTDADAKAAIEEILYVENND